MNINTRNMSFVNYNEQEMQWVKFNGVTVYEAWKQLVKNGVPPLSIYSKGLDLINYKIQGNSTQDGSVEIESVGNKTENLVDYTKAKPRNTSQSVVIDKENNAVIWTGNYYFEIPVNITVGETVIATAESDYASTFSLLYEDNTYTNTRALGYSLVAQKNVIAVRYYKSSPAVNGENMVYKNIMVVYGTKVKEYEPYGYKIPVKVSNDTEEYTTNIYLNEPLTINDYIDYKNQVLSKNGVEETIELPNIPTIKGTTVIEVDTNIQPSNMEVTYKGKGE